MLFLFACLSTQPPTVETPKQTTPVQKKAPTLPKESKKTISVFFWNTAEQKLIPVKRNVDKSDAEQQALQLLYKGPDASESSLSLLTCQSTGAQIQSIQDGLARVQLLGDCGSCGSMSIYDSLVSTLKQFPSIHTVHVLDPQGKTQADGNNIDARPACLNP